MHKLEVIQFKCRSDNFGVLLHDRDANLTASIDTPDGEVIWRELVTRKWQLTHIFNTHHHYDHVPGNEMLKERTGCMIVGAKNDASRIPGIDCKLEDGEVFPFGTHQIRLIETPGHTLGSVCYYVEPDRILFTGDTLFSMGCGRMFEGRADVMWQSMLKLRALPDETMVYCGHEYTLQNAEFALEVDPHNKALHTRVEEVKKLRRAHKDTLPVALGTEKETNPFLRADRAEIKKYFGLERQPDAECFAAARQLKNEF